VSIMLNEFLSAPDVIRSVITENKKVWSLIAKEFKKRSLTNITTVARGTSDNAATYFKYLVETIGEIMVSKFTPSVTTYYGAQVNLKNNMVLAISQSGQSTDTLMVVQGAKQVGAMTVAVTNNPDSPLAQICDFHINLAAGIERSLSATKSFIAQLTAMFLLSNSLSSITAKMNVAELPYMVDKFINDFKDKIKGFADKNKSIDNFIVLTRGLNQAVASELSLKMMEVCGKLNRPFSTADFMHGAICMVKEETEIIMLAPASEFSEEFVDLARRLSLLGAHLISFTDIKEIQSVSTSYLDMPLVRGMNTPFLYTIAIELFVVYMAEALNLDPDKPKNKKKITITK